MRVVLVALLGLPVVGTAHAQVFSSEFFSDPISEQWELVQQYCDPETWIDNGWYYQQLDFDACPPPPDGGQDSYVRWITEYNGEPEFFLEFRVVTDGDKSEIPGGAPAPVTMFNFFGISYHVTVSRDEVKFLRDVELPIYFFDIDPDVPHTYRVELYPGWYIFYIDTWVADEGIPEGPFPSDDARITWRGKAWYLPCENAWDYIRYGVIPQDASGDYDSDDLVNLDDFYYVHECFLGPDVNAGPGCRFTDFDDDTDVDLHDFALFQNAFTGGD